MSEFHNFRQAYKAWIGSYFFPIATLQEENFQWIFIAAMLPMANSQNLNPAYYYISGSLSII